MFIGVAEEVGNEFVRCVDPLVVAHRDPGARVAAGLRYSLSIARQYPICAAFIVKGGAMVLRSGGEATRNLMRDVSAGVANGRFSPLPDQLVIDLVFGSVTCALESVLDAGCKPEYPELFAQSVLMALGVPRKSAQRLSSMQLEPLLLSRNSLLVRAGTI